ncbi:MAG: response regulator transcription factor [Candidatus Accumulibacter sp.]|nr:response regulator transcription factor [Accumulibacter sp.]
MRQVFLSIDARQRDAWRSAFPASTVGRLDDPPSDTAVIWLLLPAEENPATVLDRLRQRSSPESRWVVLADAPDEDAALAALAAGAVGYCNGQAAPTVLQQVATVVENGGLWIGQGLMKRLLTTTYGLLSKIQPTHAGWRDRLTAREQEVAHAVAAGASNKEIARQLEIAERTVKFHVSALLDKLGARDRLQLSLIINGVPRNT